MTQHETNRPPRAGLNGGRVILVGAGPGDPGLMTVRGMQRLRTAGAVVYDALANPRLLDEAPPNAERHDVGKRAGHHKRTQDETNALLVELARRGLDVVRLKGGDPYLYGRGAEEAAYCHAHGVRCEVIPGVTAGIAAPMYAGIPVTHRHLASTVTFITGHEDPSKDETSIDYPALAALIGRGGTACFYMGVARLPSIADRLAACGLATSTPAAIIQWGTLPQQRSARGTLATLPEIVEQEGIGSPAIIVVGPAAGIDEPGLHWFENRPLFGRRILVTRTRQQASKLRELLEEQGAQVLEAPTIEVVPPETWDEVDEMIRGLEPADVLVLTSPNAVTTLADRLEALKYDTRQLYGVSLAVIGDATAEVLYNRLRLHPTFVPREANGEAMAKEILALDPPLGNFYKLLRADIARPALPRLLREAGHTVTETVAYRTRPVAALSEDVLDALRQGRVDWVTYTSRSTARNLVELLSDERSLLNATRAASIGPSTSATLRELGIPVAVQADEPSIELLVSAMSPKPTA